MAEIPELVYDDDDDETEIVVHTIHRGQIQKMRGKNYVYGELYTVNLKSGIVSKCDIGKLIGDDETSSMVALDDSIYILGGRVGKNSVIGKKNALVAEAAHHHFHSKASTIDIKNGKAYWKAVSHFQSLYPVPNALSFKGKIYQLSGSRLDPDRRFAGDVFDPNTGKWDLLLPPPEHVHNDDDDYWAYYVSSPSLVDVDNNRIIVHSMKYNSIYAYYPDESRWLHLVSDFGEFQWYRLGLVHDGILLFHLPDHPDCFTAFDLNARRHLNPVFSDPNSITHFRYPLYVSLFPLRTRGTFCFATFTTAIDRPLTRLIFVKFRVERITEQGRDPLITFISSKTFDVHSKCYVSNFVPLEPVLNPLFKFKTEAKELGSCTTPMHDISAEKRFYVIIIWKQW